MLLSGQPAWKAALSENTSGTFFAPFSLRSRSCHTLDASHVPGVSHLHVAVVFPSFPGQWLERTWHLGKENTLFRESPEDFSPLRESPTPKSFPSASKSSPPSHPVVPPRPPQWYSPSAGRAGGAPPGGTTQKACGGGGCRKHRLFSPAAPTRLFPSWLSTSGRRRAPGPPTPRVSEWGKAAAGSFPVSLLPSRPPLTSPPPRAQPANGRAPPWGGRWGAARSRPGLKILRGEKLSAGSPPRCRPVGG